MAFTNDPTNNVDPARAVGSGGGGGGGGTVTLDGPSLAALEAVDLNAATLAALEAIDLNAASLAALESVDLNAATITALTANDLSLTNAVPTAFAAGALATDRLRGWSIENTSAALCEISVYFAGSATGPKLKINLAENETHTIMFPDGGIDTPAGLFIVQTAGTAAGTIYTQAV